MDVDLVGAQVKTYESHFLLFRVDIFAQLLNSANQILCFQNFISAHFAHVSIKVEACHDVLL